MAGIIRAMELHDEEITRLKDCDDPEVVMKWSPKKIYIEVPSGTKHMQKIDGKKMFLLTVQAKPWSLDEAGAVKIMRLGFPIVPDFGGTAHAYCGSTMEATMGDLLEWFRKPQMDAMLKAYIIKSRVRFAENLLLVQPYSPHLFRQGVLPGPQLLLDVLLGKRTYEDAQKAWKKHEKDDAKKRSVTKAWLLEQTLPCRLCTDNNDGVEVWLPLRAFTTSDDPEVIWKRVVAKGADLACNSCRRALHWESRTTGAVVCDRCLAEKPERSFVLEDVKAWRAMFPGEIVCNECENRSRSRKDEELFRCSGACQTDLPAYQFPQNMLNECILNKTQDLMLKCARCVVTARNLPETETGTCRGCGATKHVSEFNPASLKDYLAGMSRRNVWKCYDCLFPPCCGCAKRPLTPPPRNAFNNGKYKCTFCKYPPCAMCQITRMIYPGREDENKVWLCEGCVEKRPSCKCGELQKIKDPETVPRLSFSPTKPLPQKM